MTTRGTETRSAKTEGLGPKDDGPVPSGTRPSPCFSTPNPILEGVELREAYARAREALERISVEPPHCNLPSVCQTIAREALKATPLIGLSKGEGELPRGVSGPILALLKAADEAALWIRETRRMAKVQGDHDVLGDLPTGTKAGARGLRQMRALRAATRALISALARPSEAALSGLSLPGMDVLTASIAEVMAEGDGHWSACTGCQESNEGHVSTRDYPYSETFKCQPGGGCGECGGIGVTWTPAGFYDGIGEFFQAQERTRENVRAILWKHLGGDDRYGAIREAVEEIAALSTVQDGSVREEGDTWVTLTADRALYVDRGTNTILCDHLPSGPITLTLKNPLPASPTLPQSPAPISGDAS